MKIRVSECSSHLSNSRTIADKPLNFEPLSSDKDETRAGTSHSELPHHANERTLNVDRFNVNQPSTRWIFVHTGTRTRNTPATSL
ncbi:hypothetical protein TNCV_1515431 [Trichonephila clavipes]|nr:hypothetical protein TNCV_1515431 [Trichonephila clavipes]